MNINRDKLTVYCHVCDKDQNLYTDILINELVWCIDCLTELGNENDLIEIFMRD